MTRAECLPFDHGFKDGLVVYLRRLGVFLGVMAVAAIVCGLVGYFFIPHALSPPANPSTPQPVNDGPGIGLITMISLGTGIAVLSLRRFFSESLRITFSSHTISVGGGLFWAMLVSGTMFAILTHENPVGLTVGNRIVDTPAG
jgi:hypothetical protein